MLHEAMPAAYQGNRRIAVFISGGGTTLDNLIRFRKQELELGRTPPFEIAAVISSSEKAGGLRFAAAANIPIHIVRFGTSEQSLAAGSTQAFEICRQAKVNLVVLGGFLKLLTVPEDFDLRVLNIHPSLIPAFSGHGFYGLRVHQAVLDYGAQVSGCTVHFVDNHFDHGRIVAQKVVPVLPDDTAAQLQQRVFAAECEIFPVAIKAYLDGQLRIAGRRVLWR